MSFQDKETKHSIDVKHSIASGWNHHHHAEWVAEYRDRYFDDVQKLVGVLTGDHFEIFYDSFAPIDDDLAYQISRYEKIVFPVGKDKHTRDILKIIDNLKRRLNAYKLYSVVPALWNDWIKINKLTMILSLKIGKDPELHIFVFMSDDN